MPYTHFRMIAYEVPTVVSRIGGGGLLSGWDPGPDPGEIGEIPVSIPSNTGDKGLMDARIRLNRMARVVNGVERYLNPQQPAQQNSTILNIFIMPEFYFRPNDPPLNTYSETNAYSIYNALGSMFQDARFANWLFVCGTVMWRHEWAPQRTVYRNTAIWVRGGIGGPQGWVEKQDASTIDGIDPARSPGLAPETAPFFSDWPQRRNRIFELDTLSFGLEICLDHLDHPQYHTVRSIYKDWPFNERQQWRLAIHLLTAGGMDMHPGSVTADPGGYFVRNDGMAGGVAVPHSELLRVTEYTKEYDHNPMTRGWKEIANVDPVVVGIRRFPLGPELRIDIPLGYHGFTQQCVIYPPQRVS